MAGCIMAGAWSCGGRLTRRSTSSPLRGAATGVQMAGWFNREINSIEDLQGLKMRIPGLAGDVFAEAGGTAVRIPGGELYTSLQTGVIDAAEWVGPYNDLALGLHEVAKYYYYPGWHEPGSMLELIINKDSFEALPPDIAGDGDLCREGCKPGYARRVHGAQ